jgi:5-methylcytosine-specific restriction enzyme subunit McrC
MNNVIQVFEHTTLPVGGPFTPGHFKFLVHYNERHGNQFFAIGLDRIYFRNYVGVIQVGSLTIEILPKADKVPDSPTQKKKWQSALIEMLRQSGFIRVASMSDARLRLRSSSLLDIYFESFLAEVDELVHHGLVRKYRQTYGNLPTLKGRILFQQHLAKNIIHREQFFTAHLFYDRNNPFNQILRVALDVLVRVSSNPHLIALARSLAVLFEDVDVVEVTDRTFNRLSYTRNTERYRRALQLARLIILNYSPDIRGGREDVLAILFDMNSLFERYVYVQLKRAEAKQAFRRISFRAQVSCRFWSADDMQKSIRPDIIAQIGTGPDYERVVMDTKWKIPGDGKPSAADLQQMHAYNVQFGARRSFLLYPRVGTKADVQGRFSRGEALQPSFDHNCAMVFLELFEGDKLRRDLGKNLAAMLTNSRAGFKEHPGLI